MSRREDSVERWHRQPRKLKQGPAGRDAAEAEREADEVSRRDRLEERKRMGRWAANGSDR